MSSVLSRFTPAGVDEFVRWIQHGASGPVPNDLLVDNAYCEPLSKLVTATTQQFSNRYEFGRFLVELLRPFDRQSMSYDRGLWSWLAAFYFEQLCPRDDQGKRVLRKYYVYAL